MSRIADDIAHVELPGDWTQTVSREYIDNLEDNLRGDISAEADRATQKEGELEGKFNNYTPTLDIPGIKVDQAKKADVADKLNAGATMGGKEVATTDGFIANAYSRHSNYISTTTDINKYYGENYWGRSYWMYGGGANNPSLPDGTDNETACGIFIERCNIGTVQTVTDIRLHTWKRYLNEEGQILENWKEVPTTDGTVKSLSILKVTERKNIDTFIEPGWYFSGTFINSPLGETWQLLNVESIDGRIYQTVTSALLKENSSLGGRKLWRLRISNGTWGNWDEFATLATAVNRGGYRQLQTPTVAVTVSKIRELGQSGGTITNVSSIGRYALGSLVFNKYTLYDTGNINDYAYVYGKVSAISGNTVTIAGWGYEIFEAGTMTAQQTYNNFNYGIEGETK